MKELLNFLIKSILGQEADFLIEETKTNEISAFNIKIKGDGAGQLIGKKGRTIRAIKTILAARSKGQFPFTVSVQTDE